MGFAKLEKDVNTLKDNLFVEYIKVAVVGATGYTGIEVIRLLLHHPKVVIKYLSASQNVDILLSEIYPHILDSKLFVVHTDDINFYDLDAVFLCLPHGQSSSLVSKIPQRVRIIDLSADFRIKDLSLYEQWYGLHKAPGMIEKSVYGLPEVYKKHIKSADLVACPGCYATAMLLPLLPLLRMIKKYIIIDAKSGASGAGRGLSTDNLFCEVNGNVKAYKISEHRHIPEVEQEIRLFSQDQDITIQFVPHLIPINRGILCNIYLSLEQNFSVIDANNVLSAFYKDSPFVSINADKAVNIRSVVGTNQCQIGVFPGRIKNSIIVISAIDNLLKGASGQAVQNFNIMFGFDETTGLLNVPFYP